MAKASKVIPPVTVEIPMPEGAAVPVQDPTESAKLQTLHDLMEPEPEISLDALADAEDDTNVNYHLATVGLTNSEWDQYSSLSDEDKGYLEAGFKNAVHVLASAPVVKPELRTGMTVTYVSQTPYGNAYCPAVIMSIHPDHIGLRVFCDKSGGSEWPVNAAESDSRKPGTFYR